MPQSRTIVTDDKSVVSAYPSPLTIQLVWREILSLEKFLTSQIGDTKEAIKLAHEDVVRVPTDVQKQVGALKELLTLSITEKFDAINNRLDIAEKARVELKNDSSKALDDAFRAAKEDARKSELFYTKQMDQHELLISNNKQALEDKIDLLRIEVTKVQSIALGNMQSRTAVSGTVGLIIAIIGCLIGILLYISSK